MPLIKTLYYKFICLFSAKGAMTSSDSKSNTPSFVGRSAFHRINFLYQASCAVDNAPVETKRILSAHYGKILSKVAKKSVLRMDMDMKRNLCKGCGTVLANDGSGNVVRKKKKHGGYVRQSCTTCSTHKTFPVRKNYQIWHVKKESIHAVIVDKVDTSRDAKSDSNDDQTIKMQLKS
jgi:RNase P subunit RPR2